MEIDAFFRGQERKDHFLVPKQIMDRSKTEKVDIIYAEQYDKTEIAKNGLKSFKVI
eukprot:CAMPEP_0114579564 /NCGR_PEP_ID=MMETSP0125-20121206/3898_1 /TAXON_ID=485358 ORGANISM="Aristerostoma sp., Strain ATCC 50986" /NCGR_SAMPLE_ID=MMETSP0125 /ASSEMBLY_ACC=CAM_ASM_000245 /LENGTH=55 /DNA_ID=CAMNT_0001770349 /DNA_START=1285 /DNA_END=1452 /DNA_ORIENTATION=-